MNCLVSCNHLFYYPDNKIYSTPGNLGIKYEDYDVLSSSENKIKVWRLHHNDKNSKPSGTILHLHGNAQNMTSHFNFVSWLTDYGYDVVTFDYSGYGESEGETTRLATVEDTVSVINWLRKNPWQVNGPIFVIAQSLGGAIALPAIHQAGSKGIAALVLDSTFSSYRSMCREVISSIPVLSLLKAPLSYLVTDELSPITYAKDISLPTLMFHSKSDPTVPFIEGERLFAAIGAENKKFITVESPMHTFALTSREYQKKLLDFLKDSSDKYFSSKRP